MTETVTARTNVLAREPVEYRTVVQSGSGASADRHEWGIAVEAPIEIRLNDVPWTVMLGTPADVEELAVGVAITERVLRDATAVQEVIVSEYLHDIAVNLVAPAAAFDTSVMRSRSLLGSTACGLCGLESLAELHRRAPGGSGAEERTPAHVADAAVLRAFAEMPAHQPINRLTRSVHAAAWCAPDGEILQLREDVGRHNALDKLIGALARRGALDAPGFVAMSSRCSYELVYKAAAANTQLLATISAPTSMALTWAEALHIPLACRVGGSGDARVVRFPGEVPHGG